MNILFLHRTFPAQFKHIATELAKNPKNNVVFITAEKQDEISGVRKIVYDLDDSVCVNPDLEIFDAAILHSKIAASKALELKEEGFKPDIIYGHTLGPVMFIKDVFHDVPFLCYFEWFYNAEGADAGFDGKELSIEDKIKLKNKNADILIDLYSCDAGISPTLWQKSQFPKEFQDKIKVLHDGVDTEFFKPDSNAKFIIKNKNIELTQKDEVITYATRGMEPYRGFHVFMKAAEILQKRRPNAQIVIAGEDKVFYGGNLTEGTFKEFMLKNTNLDMERMHFTGFLPYEQYRNLLQISSAHIYLTYPFVLSWSILDAMACGCAVVASNTPPVLEVIKDGENGLLAGFYNLNELISKIEFALDNKEKMKIIRQNARKTIEEKYSTKLILPEQIEYLKQVSQY